MKKITLKNWDKAPKKIYCVQFNIGGLLHDKVYVLYKKEGLMNGHYFCLGGNISCDVKDNKGITMDSVNRGNVWQYITEDEEKAKLFLLGAKSTLHFMNNQWLKYYEFKK